MIDRSQLLIIEGKSINVAPGTILPVRVLRIDVKDEYKQMLPPMRGVPSLYRELEKYVDNRPIIIPDRKATQETADKEFYVGDSGGNGSPIVIASRSPYVADVLFSSLKGNLAALQTVHFLKGSKIAHDEFYYVWNYINDCSSYIPFTITTMDAIEKIWEYANYFRIPMNAPFMDMFLDEILQRVTPFADEKLYKRLDAIVSAILLSGGSELEMFRIQSKDLGSKADLIMHRLQPQGRKSYTYPYSTYITISEEEVGDDIMMVLPPTTTTAILPFYQYPLYLRYHARNRNAFDHEYLLGDDNSILVSKEGGKWMLQIFDNSGNTFPIAPINIIFLREPSKSRSTKRLRKE